MSDNIVWAEASHGHQPPRRSNHDAVATTMTSPDGIDWTDEVAQRCYLQLAELGVLPQMSINYPATLQRELERVAQEHAATNPELSQRYIYAMGQMAVALRNGSIASSDQHRILPFDPRLLKRINIGAGIEHFVRLTGERPMAFWSPEGAMDIPTLEMLAAPEEEGGFGIRAFICAPEQVFGATEPRRIALPNGHTIVAIPFGTIGRELAFDPDRRVNADWFAARILPNLIREMHDTNAWWRVLFPWKDLETWGGHDEQKAHDPRSPGSEYFAAYLLTQTLPRWGVEVVPFKQVLIDLLADPERIPWGDFKNWSAWSCSNGLVRWDGTGHCNESGGAEWKLPFYQAHALLTKAVIKCVMEELDLRGAEGEARFAQLMQTEFHEGFMHRGGRHSGRRQSLLAAAAAAITAGNSCGTFYDNLGTSGWVNIVFARTAIEHLIDGGLPKIADRIWADYTQMMRHIPDHQLACTPEDQSPDPLAPHLLGHTATSFISLSA